MNIVFCGRNELPVVLALGFLAFNTFYMHKNLNNTLKESCVPF